MKKIFKSLITVILAICIISSVFAFNTFAAGTVISLSKSSVSVGDEVTVTITFDAGEAMYAIQGVINYNSAVLEYKSGAASGSAGVLRLVESPSGDTKVSYNLIFKSIAAGSGSISVSDCRYGALGANGSEEKGLTGASASVSVQDVTLSSNANLRSLRLSAGSLSPAFSPDITEYNVVVENDVTECKVSAVAADSSAKVSVTGSATLKIGANTRSVVVTAPNGSQKTYKLNITRNDVDENAQKLNTTVDGEELAVSTDISAITMLKGFTASTTEYNGISVPVAVDASGEYKIFYLKAADGETLVPYTFNDDIQTFEKLVYFVQGEYTYILADIPADKTLPEGYYLTNVKIAETDVECYTNDEYTDFYYLYFYNGEKYEFYRYDLSENNFQRYPNISDVKSLPVIVEQPDGFMGRFDSLSSSAKLLILFFVLLAIISIVIIVLFVIRFSIGKSNNISTLQGDTSKFDDIEISGFSFEDTKENDTDDEE